MAAAQDDSVDLVTNRNLVLAEHNGIGTQCASTISPPQTRQKDYALNKAKAVSKKIDAASRPTYTVNYKK